MPALFWKASRDIPATSARSLRVAVMRLPLLGKPPLGGAFFEAGRFQYLPVVRHPAKTIWVGLNYSDHAAEGGFDIPDFPRFSRSFPAALSGMVPHCWCHRNPTNSTMKSSWLSLSARAGDAFRNRRNWTMWPVIRSSMTPRSEISICAHRNGRWAINSITPAPLGPIWSGLTRSRPVPQT